MAGAGTLCAALGVSAAMVQAQPVTTPAAQPLPNCAVTTARVGTLDVTEFFGLPGTAGSFRQSFGPMPGSASATAGETSNASGASTGAAASTAGGNTGAATTPGGAGGTSTTGATTPTTNAGNGAGANDTTTAANANPDNTAGTNPTSANGGASAVSSMTSSPAAMMSVAQSCLRLEVENPAPGDLLEPGGYVVQGFAFDPTATTSQGTGISAIQVFLGDPNEGGDILGSTGSQAGVSTSGEFGTSNSRAASFGEQFASAGFRLTVQIPERPSNPEQSTQQALFVSATATNGERVGTVAIPVSVSTQTGASNRAP